MTRRVCTIAALMAALGCAGCEDKRLDMQNIQGIIAERFPVAGGDAVKEVVCPKVVRTKKGETFECKVVLQSGEVRAATVEQLGGTRFRWQPGTAQAGETNQADPANADTRDVDPGD